MLPTGSRSEIVPQTPLEKNLVRDERMKNALIMLIREYSGDILDHYLVAIMCNFCNSLGLKAIHGNMKPITSRDYGHTRFALLIKFEDSDIVLVSCSNGVVISNANTFDSV